MNEESERILQSGRGSEGEVGREELERLSGMWEARVLGTMNGTTWMFSILAVVIVSVAVAIVQITNDEAEGLFFDVFEYTTFSVFIVELVVRM
jgi:hypothetical protein